MRKIKAIKADHLITYENATAYYWQVAFSRGVKAEPERIPYYWLPKHNVFVMVFDLFSYDRSGTVQANIVSAPTVELLYEAYKDVIKKGDDYFIKQNATPKL